VLRVALEAGVEHGSTMAFEEPRDDEAFALERSRRRSGSSGRA
jgi:hypothetical protein